MRDLEIVLCCLHLHSQPRYPRFILCPECRVESPHESIVVERVVNYFSKPEFSQFFIETEHKIQMGSDNRRPDVVLLDGAGNFVAIAECKQRGIVTYGHEQLKSYLCATNTQFGIFANSTNPGDWEFYENLGRNRFKTIARNQFRARVSVVQSIELTSTKENVLDSERTSRARFARRRERAKRSNRQNS